MNKPQAQMADETQSIFPGGEALSDVALYGLLVLFLLGVVLVVAMTRSERKQKNKNKGLGHWPAWKKSLSKRAAVKKARKRIPGQEDTDPDRLVVPIGTPAVKGDSA